jgi:hypothetical protein
MKEFMFLYKGGDPTATRTPEEQKAVMALWGAWLGALGEKGNLVTGGVPLEWSGQRLKKDNVLTDIAASELKELVSGYSIVKADSYAQAAALARECPIFRNPGAYVEIRAVLPM